MNNTRAALSVDDWVRLNRLLEEGLELTESERGPWLDRLASEPAHVRAVLLKLLDQGSDRAEVDAVPHSIARVASDALAALHPDQPGHLVGPWRLERLLAEGGMGTVWLAERADGVMTRSAALKLPRSEWIDRGLSQRIARERSILARLQHPNIAVLYDAGVTAEGRPYLALEYVEGEPIDRFCSTRALGVRAVLELFVPVVRAVAYAHSRLVVHRDIKPSNILITDDGLAKLLDFGVSKMLVGDQTAADQTALTRLAGRPLTLPYAAPEQLLGQPNTVALDVYSLGVVLFELVTGTRQYRAQTPYALEQEILAGDIRRPSEATRDRRRASELRGDLDAILLTALKRAPEARYASAGALADDIERYLAGEAVHARPDSPMYRWMKFAARNRLPLATLAAVSFAVGLGGVIALWQANVAEQQATQANALNAFIMSLIKQADPAASPQTKRADLATLVAIDERIEHEFRGTPSQLLRLRVTVGDAYLNRGELAAARRAYKRAAEAAAGAVRSDDIQMLAARVRAADPRLIESVEEAAYLDQAIPLLEAKKAAGADVLIDALLIRHELGNNYGVPAFPTLAHRFDDLGEALRVAVRHFGEGSPQALKVMLPYANLVEEAGDRRKALELVEETLRDASKRQDRTADSAEFRRLAVARSQFLCGASRTAEGLKGLWAALDQVKTDRDETSVELEEVYVALGDCYDRIEDATGYWFIYAAYDVAAARERPPSTQLMRRAAKAMQFAADWDDFERADAYFRKAMKNSAAIPDAELSERLTRPIQGRKVCVLRFRGEPEAAERLAGQLLQSIGTEANVVLAGWEVGTWMCLSFAQRDLGRWDDAMQSARGLLDRCAEYAEVPFRLPCRNRALLALALAQVEAGQHAEALATFSQRDGVPGRSTPNVHANLGRAKALLALGETEKATELLKVLYGYWLTRPAARGPFAAEAEYWLGQAYLAAGDKRGRRMVDEARRTLAKSPMAGHRALASSSGAVLTSGQPASSARR